MMHTKVLVALAASATATTVFDTSTASAPGSVASVSLKSRIYLPYDGVHAQFGFGAAEKTAYDPATKTLYAVSEQGFVTVVDMTDAGAAGGSVVDAFAVGGGSPTDVAVCGGWLFVATAAEVKTDPGHVHIYATSDLSAPVATAEVGPLPDSVMPNPACTMAATADEGEGVYGDSLVDPAGSTTLISDWASGSPTVTTVSFAGLGTDDELIAAGVHLALPLKALEYFDDHSAAFSSDLDFAAARASYAPENNFEPEYVAWSADGATLYVNLQENSAIVTVDAASATATAIHGLPLKDWSTLGVDTVEDGACVLEPKPGFFSMRMPDTLVAFEVDGATYLATPNEGDDKEYGAYEEKTKFRDLVEDDATFGEDFAEFVDGGALAGGFANFGGTSMRVTIGSSAVDYSDPAAPVLHRVVGFGGRGMSIWAAADMALVWDSGNDFETNQCAAYPWAHNAVHDEEFALTRPPGGFLYDVAGEGLRETLEEMNDPAEDGCDDSGDGAPGACPLGQTVDDRSLKDGAGPESMAVGVACGRLLAVTATEKASTLLVYDISDVAAPTFLFAEHLSPASETLSPEIAYAEGTLGDVDPESILFVSAEDSPSGKAAAIVAGAWSGTVSFFEFACAGDEDGEDEGHDDEDHDDHDAHACYSAPGEAIHEDCTCDATCATCGYGDAPTDARDCITCAEGLCLETVWADPETGELVEYDDGTGWCGPCESDGAAEIAEIGSAAAAVVAGLAAAFALLSLL